MQNSSTRVRALQSVPYIFKYVLYCPGSSSYLAPAVVALDAIIHVRDAKRQYTTPAAHLFVAPSEDITTMHRVRNGAILTDIELPLHDGNRRSVFVKDTIRNSCDFARGSIALALNPDENKTSNVCVVIGAVAAMPSRSTPTEKALEGAELNEQTIAVTTKASTQGAVPLAFNEYKVGMAQAT